MTEKNLNLEGQEAQVQGNWSDRCHKEKQELRENVVEQLNLKLRHFPSESSFTQSSEGFCIFI